MPSRCEFMRRASYQNKAVIPGFKWRIFNSIVKVHVGGSVVGVNALPNLMDYTTVSRMEIICLLIEGNRFVYSNEILQVTIFRSRYKA